MTITLKINTDKQTIKITPELIHTGPQYPHQIVSPPPHHIITSPCFISNTPLLPTGQTIEIELETAKLIINY